MTAISETVAPLAEGFAAAARSDARILILGSLPGAKSIAAQEYFAHPRNVFWQLIEDLLAIPRTLPYATRIESLNDAGIGLWDVLQASRRKGSLDSAIDPASAIPNDFVGFFKAHPYIELIGFNGKAAAQLFNKHVAVQLHDISPRLRALPSTSPAHAAMSYAEKLQQWSQILPAERNNAGGTR